MSQVRLVRQEQGKVRRCTVNVSALCSVVLCVSLEEVLCLFVIFKLPVPMSACMVTLKCLFIYLLIDSTFQINSNVVQLKNLEIMD